MDIYIKRVIATGVHGRFDFDQELQPGVNILYGLNGSGKTTFLSIIANVLNCDFNRFKYIKFRQIKIEYSSGLSLVVSWNIKENTIQVSREGESKRTSLKINYDNKDSILDNIEIPRYDHYQPLIHAFYVPAFRLLVDAWFSSEQLEFQSPMERILNKTQYARKVFGDFVPQLSYPAIVEAMEGLNNEVQEARLELGRRERDYFLKYLGDLYFSSSSSKELTTPSNSAAIQERITKIQQLSEELENYQFQETSSSFSDFIERLLQIINKTTNNLENIEAHLIDSLISYESLFTDLLTSQKECFMRLDIYMKSVNSFLTGKKLIFANTEDDSESRTFNFKYQKEDSTLEDKIIPDGINALSSGERQIIPLLYACYVANQEVVLIDEPEISLHINWQRKLLQSIDKLSSPKQFIICTHSVSIPSTFEDAFKKLNVFKTHEGVWEVNDLYDWDYDRLRKEEKDEKEEKERKREKEEEEERKRTSS